MMNVVPGAKRQKPKNAMIVVRVIASPESQARVDSGRRGIGLSIKTDSHDAIPDASATIGWRVESL